MGQAARPREQHRMHEAAPDRVTTPRFPAAARPRLHRPANRIAGSPRRWFLHEKSPVSTVPAPPAGRRELERGERSYSSRNRPRQVTFSAALVDGGAVYVKVNGTERQRRVGGVLGGAHRSSSHPYSGRSHGAAEGPLRVAGVEQAPPGRRSLSQLGHGVGHPERAHAPAPHEDGACLRGGLWAGPGAMDRGTWPHRCRDRYTPWRAPATATEGKRPRVHRTPCTERTAGGYRHVHRPRHGIAAVGGLPHRRHG